MRSLGTNKSLQKSKVTFFILFMLLFIIIPTAEAGSFESSAVYDHLVTETFAYQDASTPAARLFESLSGELLRVVLPFMAVFGITMMVISGASTVIYLSFPPFFDDVHIAKYMRRQKLKSMGNQNKLKAWFDTMREMGIKEGLLMNYLIPDVRAMAFYDACEIGEDGRPSLATFAKNSLPKYAGIMALILLLADQTFLNIILKSGEIGVWFAKKAEGYNYIRQLERIANSGSDYNPTYKGGKKRIFTSAYSTLKNVDRRPGTEQSIYKQNVGAKLDKWVQDTFRDVDFDAVRVAVTSRAITSPVIDPSSTDNLDGPNQGSNTAKSFTGNSNMYQIPLETFGVNAESGEQYLLMEVSLSETRTMTSAKIRASSSGWSGSRSNLTFNVKSDPEFQNAEITDVYDITVSTNLTTSNKGQATGSYSNGIITIQSLDEGVTNVFLKYSVRANGQDYTRNKTVLLNADGSIIKTSQSVDEQQP